MLWQVLAYPESRVKGNNTMKKNLAIVLAFVLVLGLAACGSSGTTSQGGNNDEAAKLTGKMNIINLDDRDPSVLRGVAIKGNHAGGFDGFVTAVCKQVGAALEIPADLLLKSFDASYSASRAALLEAWKAFKMRREWFVDDFCRPVYEVWLSEAIARGRISAPGFFSDPAIREAWLGSEWTGPAQGQLDPVKEITAEQLACENGFSTREQSTIRLNGGSYEANVEQLAEENAALVKANGSAVAASTTKTEGGDPDEDDEKDPTD